MLSLLLSQLSSQKKATFRVAETTPLSAFLHELRLVASVASMGRIAPQPTDRRGRRVSHEPKQRSCLHAVGIREGPTSDPSLACTVVNSAVPTWGTTLARRETGSSAGAFPLDS